MKYSLLFILLLISLICNAAAATVYTNIDNNGNTTYSDTPLKNSKVMDIPEQSTISQPKNTVNIPSSKTVEPLTPDTPRKPYTSFTLTSPTDQQTFQNQRQIPVEVNVTPELQQGDKIVLHVDGNPYGPSEDSTHLQIGQLDRGIHTLSAVIIDKNHTVIKSTNTITIFIHFASLGGGNP